MRKWVAPLHRTLIINNLKIKYYEKFVIPRGGYTHYRMGFRILCLQFRRINPHSISNCSNCNIIKTYWRKRGVVFIQTYKNKTPSISDVKL